LNLAESMDEKLKQRIDNAIREEISIVPYRDEWPSLFQQEASFLRSHLPSSIVGRIEHFGSTAVAGLAAKPIVDLLVEVSSLKRTKEEIVPLLQSLGYDYFWRLDCTPPYAWFIKRDERGIRTHHLHMVEAASVLWERLCFRDYLREFPAEAKQYQDLKLALAEKYPRDRVAYTNGKTKFIEAVTEKAKDYYGGK
jgi:GrpB-like predicted nucleotidyltransferase (UPF0157 family)